jgi:nitrogen-specific signal transduction histidine kinase
MKPELTFVLENAGWPALLVSDSGVVLRANSSATNTFGPLSGGNTSLSASIWSRENPSSPEVFLAGVERSAATSVALKLRTKDGHTSTFHASVCPCATDGQKMFLWQLFGTNAPSASPPGPQSGGPASPAPAKIKVDDPAIEAGMVQKQRLDCALQLTRTVALDFNNALTSILGHTSLILSKIEPSNPWRGSLLEIEKSAEKAAEITADLAAFSRQERDSTDQAAGNLNELVRRVVSLFQTPENENIIWGMELQTKLYTTLFEEAKLQQAFIKLMENAVEALENSRQILVRTRNHDFTEPQQDGNVRLAAGSYVCVEFEDSGCGIPANLLTRIFEPFFTTKNRPLHRGLGLAWVYGIVTNHGGSVAVTSQPGLGTAVRVYLPALKRIVRDHAVDTGDLTGSDAILWQNQRGNSYTPSPVLHEGKFYMLTDNGMLSCLDAATGKPHYAQQRLPTPYNFKASPVAVNGKLYLSAENGDVIVVKMGEAFEVIATNSFPDHTFIATPAVSGGSMYLRSDRAIFCVRR